MHSANNEDGRITSLMEEAAAFGVQIDREGMRLSIEGPCGSAVDILNRLRSERVEVMRMLEARNAAGDEGRSTVESSDPVTAAYRLWKTALDDVRERWNALYHGKQDSPFLDDARIDAVLDRVGEMIRRGDVEGTSRIIEECNAAWSEMLQPTVERS